MKSHRLVSTSLACLTAFLFQVGAASSAEPTPDIATLSKPAGGEMIMMFHGGTGPFQVQQRMTLDAEAEWSDVPSARVTKLNDGVFLATMPIGDEVNAAFYRVQSMGETIVELKGWSIYLEVSEPANGQYFTQGEAPVVTVKVLDTFGGGIGPDDFSSLNLYMWGPQDPRKTVSANKLLNANEDRSQRPHHYIDLRSSPGVQLDGQVYTYPLQAVTDEEPGTYQLGLWVGLRSDGFAQVMRFAQIQIGTATVEEEVVAAYAPDGSPKCAACHEGTISGKMYLHHIDPGYSPTGNWSLDFTPVMSCKACHNLDGYAAYRAPDSERIPDPIVRRIHGVHRGSGLELEFNNDPIVGDFADYIHVDLPADIRNCAACHVDDRYKTVPSRLACGACHDNVWFGEYADLPDGMEQHFVPQTSDETCAYCHTPDSGGYEFEGKDMAVAMVHAIPVEFDNQIDLSLSPPANGTHYVDGEEPTLTVKLQELDADGVPTGVFANPNEITTDSFSRLRLQVSGPRALTEPVLTTASTDPTKSGSGSYIYNDLRAQADPMEDDPRITRTTDAIEYQLESVTGLAAGTYSVYVQGRTNGVRRSDVGIINFQVGTASEEARIATSCTDCHASTKMHGSYPFNVDLCKNCHDYQQRYADRVNWDDRNWGFGAAPLSRRVHGVHYGKYLHKPGEIHGEEDAEHFGGIIFPQDVRNCTKCHSESPTWKEKPSRLACMACHDSDDSLLHGALMTWDPTPAQPFSGDEQESCRVCHGKGKDFSPDKVHAISDPYVPPYPREPAGGH